MFPLMAFCFISQLTLLPLVYLFMTETDSNRRKLIISLLQFVRKGTAPSFISIIQISSLFLLSYGIGFVKSAAMRKAMTALGLITAVVSKVGQM